MDKKILESISNVTNDNFIILSTHDDIDILADSKYKNSIVKIFESFGFKSETKNPHSECLYYAEHDIQFFKDDKHYDLHSGLCYNGLKPNSYIPIDNQFEEYCFKNRIKTNDVWKYKLSVESDIVHTVCRIIFDKKDAPQHYIDKLNDLVNDVDEKELLYAFKLALFDYAKHACKLVLECKFKELPTNYISRCDY
tara:strand:+ start:637 stop:1221 length:585 start_codon:yes stop_codon:yes gene_type:complete